FAVISAAAVLGGVSLQAQSTSGPTMPGPNLSGNRLTPEQEQQLRDQLHKTISNINAQSSGGTSVGGGVTAVTPPAMPVTPPPVAAPVTPAPVMPVTVTPTTPAPGQGFGKPATPTANAMTPEQEEKIRAALRQAVNNGKAPAQAGTISGMTAVQPQTPA